MSFIDEVNGWDIAIPKDERYLAVGIDTNVNDDVIGRIPIPSHVEVDSGLLELF
jgi:hypothetical protein